MTRVVAYTLLITDSYDLLKLKYNFYFIRNPNMLTPQHQGIRPGRLNARGIDTATATHTEPIRPVASYSIITTTDRASPHHHAPDPQMVQSFHTPGGEEARLAPPQCYYRTARRARARCVNAMVTHGKCPQTEILSNI